jgi:3-oxoacyl-[acyl-carrier protein] reductase
MEKIEGKVALITGGSKGIGLGIAVSLIQQGVYVAITGRSESDVKKAAGELGKNAIGLVGDVRNRQDQDRWVAEVIQQWGKLDVLVANAGVGAFISIDEMTVGQWNEMIDINLTGVFHSVQTTLPYLKKSKGYIITIASLAGTNFFAGGSAYSATKFGLVGFTQSIMLDLRKHNIKVSTIMPGSVATYFNGHEPSSSDAWKIQPEDIGQLVVDLLRMNPRTLPSKIEVRPSNPH